MIFELVFLLKTTIKTDNGIIHNALPNLIVVATFNASTPYFDVAPTPELVSWIAVALHKPNWYYVRLI